MKKNANPTHEQADAHITVTTKHISLLLRLKFLFLTLYRKHAYEIILIIRAHKAPIR